MANDISLLKGLKNKAYVTDRYAEDRDENIMVMHIVEMSGDNIPGGKRKAQLMAINPKDALRRFCYTKTC